MAPFKVIIVGGSVAGMALANMLERYGIDFTVIEKHRTIAPQLGAGFALLPNGSRILDQLGCYDELKKLSMPVNSGCGYDQHGDLWISQPGLGKWMAELFGYKIRFLERRQLIQVLFNRLSDKSKVHTSGAAVKIRCCASGVSVETEDGTVFEGDIVVGADGVHSRVVQEMQRLAEAEIPGKVLFQQKNAFQCTYCAIFGISMAPEGVIGDQAIKNYREGRSYLCAGGREGKLYWVFMIKTDKQTRGFSIPHYTDEDRDRLAAMYKDDIVKPGVTFGDIYQNRLASALVPLEEGVLESCFYRRIVLVGDSWHKIHPLSGQGGNNAIMSAACLADHLKCLTRNNVTPDEASLQDVFRRYQHAREPDSREVVQMSHQLQRMEALDTPLLRFVLFNVVRKLPIEAICNISAQSFTAALPLKYLPLPSRRGHVPFDDEIILRPRTRSNVITAFWMSLLVLMTLAQHVPSPQGKRPIQPASSQCSPWMPLTVILDCPRAVQLYFHVTVTAVASIIGIESYRQFFLTRLLGSALPFGIASLFVGWEIVLPVYFMLFILLTARRPFYYPSARAIDLTAAKALITGYLVTYVPVILLTLISPAFPSRTWIIAHAIFPLMVQLLRRMASRYPSVPKGPGILYGVQDIGPLAWFLRLVYAIQHITSLSVERSFLLRLIAMCRSRHQGENPGDDAKTVFLEAAIMVFLCFAYWDLRRVRGISRGFVEMALYGGIISFGISPTVALVLFWLLRETEWERARERLSADARESVVLSSC